MRSLLINKVKLVSVVAEEDVQKIDKYRYPMKDIDVSDLVENASERTLVSVALLFFVVINILGKFAAAESK